MSSRGSFITDWRCRWRGLELASFTVCRRSTWQAGFQLCWYFRHNSAASYLPQSLIAIVCCLTMCWGRVSLLSRQTSSSSTNNMTWWLWLVFYMTTVQSQKNNVASFANICMLGKVLFSLWEKFDGLNLGCGDVIISCMEENTQWSTVHIGVLEHCSYFKLWCSAKIVSIFIVKRDTLLELPVVVSSCPNTAHYSPHGSKFKQV